MPHTVQPNSIPIPNHNNDVISYAISCIPMGDAVPEAVIGTYLWENNGYAPRASAWLTLVDGTLLLRMRAEEADPLIRYHRGDVSPRVWCDSCLEFFFSANDMPAYVNLEMNADGCYICNFGEGRHDRRACDIFAEDGQPTATVGEEFWQIDASLSLQKIAILFGVEAITSLRGNFYKCGDETTFPHFGMWAKVDLPSPDFHRPEYFCPLLLPYEQ